MQDILVACMMFFILEDKSNTTYIVEDQSTNTTFEVFDVIQTETNETVEGDF